MDKLRSDRGGVSRLHVMIAVAILIMIVVIGIPGWRAFKQKSQEIACEQAMKSAGDGLIIEYLGSGGQEASLEQAKDIIDVVMVTRDDICPAHGNIYLIKEEHGIYQPKCGLHDKDKKERTRLNATFVRDNLIDARRKMKDKAGKNWEEPESITLMVNGKPLEIMHVTEEEMIHRGTRTTNGYKGVVAYYGVKGDFEFSPRGKAESQGHKDTIKKGEICYIDYADPNYCAIWRSNVGWTGDAYEGLSQQ